jgi:hypothetical protein
VARHIVKVVVLNHALAAAKQASSWAWGYFSHSEMRPPFLCRALMASQGVSPKAIGLSTEPSTLSPAFTNSMPIEKALHPWRTPSVGSFHRLTPAWPAVRSKGRH